MAAHLLYQNSVAYTIPFKYSSPATAKSTRSGFRVCMRDRSNNRKPLQKGRHLSIEAIQAVHSLKRAFRRSECDAGEESDQSTFQQVYDSKFKRLLRLDMIAVLRELLRQNQCHLALKVFEDIRRESWYKPAILLYSEMFSVFSRNGLFEHVNLLYNYLREEDNLKPDLEKFNTLLRTLVSSGLAEKAVGCYQLMNKIECDADRETYRILINGLGEFAQEATFAGIKEDAVKCYGNLDFLLEHEEIREPIAKHKLVSGWNSV
ncbi:hypothetical protein MLD38_024418 [Melastoma candidum]|uniref:Uncharacterized protein n=1 Tax=Melastoma candidum TaxID=119954 RepID=A0ACB9NTX7_9MYRT|nr:hypothetical protein MLD38_024418 [Melastoma candidum]